MQKVQLRFVYDEDDMNRPDDVITIYERRDLPDTYRVVYAAGDLTRAKEFYLSSDRVMDYIEDALCGLEYDTDPFSHVQVLTCIHPSTMYHSGDLYGSVRRLILRTIWAGLRTPVEHKDD